MGKTRGLRQLFTRIKLYNDLGFRFNDEYIAGKWSNQEFCETPGQIVRVFKSYKVMYVLDGKL